MTLKDIYELYAKWKQTEREFNEFFATCNDEEEVTGFALDVINDRDAFRRALRDWITTARAQQ